MALYRFANIDQTSSRFRRELESVAARLDTDPNYLAATIETESGFDAQAFNPVGGGGGLIGFMPSTARALGTTVQALLRLTDAEQLEWVERFYRPYRGRLTSPEAVKMATFLPAFMDRDPSFVVGRRNDPTILRPSNLSLGIIYEQNAAMDRDGDGELTIAEVTGFARRAYDRAKQRGTLEAAPDPKEAEAAALLSACRSLLSSAWRSLRRAFGGGDE